MKQSTLFNYLAEGFGIFRRNGLKSIMNPVSLFGEVARLLRYKKSVSLIISLDYSTSDLAKNRELMTRFSEMKNLRLETINWFIPYFEHPYGGIYTILRFADYFHAKRNIKNRFIICGNPLASTVETKNKIVRSFPNLSSEEIVVLRNNNVKNLPYADICIATSWTSAYFALKFNKTMGKFYFIQDYEPLFYPAGAVYALAEATYRFGFYGIANTPGLYNKYTQDYGGIAEYFVPSVDRDVFYPPKREASELERKRPFTIFFYTRPDVPRNAFELGILALQRIKKNHGASVRIYTAGRRWNPRNYGVGNVVVDLGVLPYEQTASLYRNCDIGMVFMFTAHPSYLPFELMACGCVVLTNHNPATTWLLKDGINCMLTEPTVSCVSEKIETLMHDSHLRKQLASNGLGTIGETSWDGEVEKIYSFICKLEGSRRSDFEVQNLRKR